MADVKKPVEKEILMAIRSAMTGEDIPEGIYAEDVVDYIDKKIAQIEAKAAKAKETRAAKKAENDELKDRVATLLTTELQTAQEITDVLDDAEVSKSKVQYRLTALVNEGVAVKEKIKVDKDTRMAYKLA